MGEPDAVRRWSSASLGPMGESSSAIATGRDGHDERDRHPMIGRCAARRLVVGPTDAGGEPLSRASAIPLRAVREAEVISAPS